MFVVIKMVNNIKKKGQSFSTDILVVVVILLFGVLFLVANKVTDDNNDDKINDLMDKANKESKLIVEELKNSLIIDSQNNVDVEDLKKVNLQDMKEDLSIKGDFCIVFEKDGKLVKIDAENNITGIGSEKIIVNNVPCKSS